jgi:hypothetical protein
VTKGSLGLRKVLLTARQQMAQYAGFQTSEKRNQTKWLSKEHRAVLV